MTPGFATPNNAQNTTRTAVQEGSIGILRTLLAIFAALSLGLVGFITINRHRVSSDMKTFCAVTRTQDASPWSPANSFEPIPMRYEDRVVIAFGEAELDRLCSSAPDNGVESKERS